MKKEKQQSCQLGLISIEIKLISCSFLFRLVLYLVFYMQEGIYWHKTNNHSTHSQLCPVSQFSVNRMLQNVASFFFILCQIREDEFAVGLRGSFPVFATVRCTLPLIGHMSAVKNLRSGTTQLNRKAARVWALSGVGVAAI